MADVIFVFPPAHGNRARFRTHLGAAYVQAALGTRGIGSRQFLWEGSAPASDIAGAILDDKPKIVGFTAYNESLGLCLNLARQVKALSPFTRVVLGGPTATFSYRRIFAEDQPVDVCCAGEMEEAGPRIIEVLLDAGISETGERLRSIAGVAIREGGEVIFTGLPPLPPENGSGPCPLDNIPSPYLSGVLSDGRAGVLTGRGCNQNCVYCCFAALGRRKVRLHSVDRVMAELEVIAHHVRTSGEQYLVTFHDDTFTLLPERARELCEEIVRRQFGLKFSCITRADKVDEELLDLMKAAGFVAVAFGLESAVPSVLRTIGKVRPPDFADTTLAPEREFVGRVRKAVMYANRLGLSVGVSIIIGLPGERREDAEQTLAFVHELPVDYYMHNVLTVFEGTPLWESHRRYDIDVGDGPDGLPVVTKYSYDPFSVTAIDGCFELEDAVYVLNIAAQGLFGCCAIAAEDARLGLIVLRMKALSQEVAEWLADVAPSDGTVLHVYEDPRHAGSDLAYDNLRFVASRIPSRYYLQAVRDGEDGEGRTVWRVFSPFSDIAEPKSSELVRFRTAADGRALEEWIMTGQATADICDPADVLADDVFVGELSNQLHPERFGERLSRKPVPPLIRHVGRFLKGTPLCAGLSRIEVDGTGAVRVCQNGPIVGRVGDSVTTLARNTADALPSVCPVVQNKAAKTPDLVSWLTAISRIPFYVYDAVDRIKSG
jgi:radical SAM superfamily enzyme YgiQ (UPF0313 family)